MMINGGNMNVKNKFYKKKVDYIYFTQKLQKT